MIIGFLLSRRLCPQAPAADVVRVFWAAALGAPEPQPRPKFQARAQRPHAPVAIIQQKSGLLGGGPTSQGTAQRTAQSSRPESLSQKPQAKRALREDSLNLAAEHKDAMPNATAAVLALTTMRSRGINTARRASTSQVPPLLMRIARSPRRMSRPAGGPAEQKHAAADTHSRLRQTRVRHIAARARASGDRGQSTI